MSSCTVSGHNHVIKRMHRQTWRLFRPPMFPSSFHNQDAAMLQPRQAWCLALNNRLSAVLSTGMLIPNQKPLCLPWSLPLIAKREVYESYSSSVDFARAESPTNWPTSLVLVQMRDTPRQYASMP